MSKGKRKLLQTVKKLSVPMDIIPVFDDNVKSTLHVLMELAVRS